MKSVKYIYGISFAAVALAMTLSSCRFEEDDIFDDSAAIRIEKFNDEVESILTASEHGWVMQYYTLDETCGYNFFCKFYPGGQVTVGGSHAYLPNGNVYTEYNSLYKMLKEDGSVLSFCTWNDIISIFADPKQANPSTGREGEGMGGDYNFMILSATDDEIVMRGQRHGAQVRLVKCPTAWAEYRAATDATSANFFNRRVAYYYMVSGNDTLYASGMADGILTIVDNIDDPMSTVHAPFVTTPNGIYLERSYKQNGNAVQELVMNADSTAFVSADGKFVFSPAWEVFNRMQVNGNRKVKITGEGACEAFQTAFDELSAALQGSYRQSLENLTFGTSTEGQVRNRRTGVAFASKSGRSTYVSAFTSSIVCDGNEVSIHVDVEDGSGNVSSYSSRPGVVDKLKAMAALLEGTFTVTVDNIFNPVYAKFVSNSDPGFYFVAEYSAN